MDLTTSFPFQSCEVSDEFQNLQEMFNDSKVQDLKNSLYEFPNLDDICLQPQSNNDSIELLPLGNVDFLVCDNGHKPNQYNAIETTPDLSRISSLSSNSSMVVNPVEHLSNVTTLSTGFARNIPDYSRLLYNQGGNMDAKYSMTKKFEGRIQKKSNVERGKWTLEEDRLLTQLVKQHGLGKWSHIAQFMNGRIGKQCRDRWYNHLRPNIKKDSWTEEEDRILISAHMEIGNKWTEIAKRIPGRTENSIKNRWNATKRRQLSRKCTQASKYPKPGTLLQNYIKKLSTAQEKQLENCYKNNSLQPLTSFNKMNEIYIAPSLFNHQQYGENMTCYGKRDDYRVKMEWDAETSGFGNRKMEMDLVEMINYTNESRFNSNSFCSF